MDKLNNKLQTKPKENYHKNEDDIEDAKYKWHKEIYENKRNMKDNNIGNKMKYKQLAKNDNR